MTPFSNQSATTPGAFAEPPYVPPPQKSKRWPWLLGGCGCIAALLALCCGGVTWWVITYSNNVVAENLEAQLAGNENIERALGEIVSLKANLVDSGDEAQKRGGPNHWVVMDAVGTK